MDVRCPPHTLQIFSGSTFRELVYRFPKGQVLGKSYGTKWDAPIGNMLGATHWQLEEHAEKALGTWWEHIGKNINPQKSNTPPSSSPKEKKLGCIGCLLQLLNCWIEFIFPPMFITYFSLGKWNCEDQGF